MVNEDDDILRALRLVIARDITDLPVLNKKNQIIEDVTIPDLLSKILESASGWTELIKTVVCGNTDPFP